MTEKELLAAVHAYVVDAYPEGVEAEFPPLNIGLVHTASTKLLDAIRKWVKTEMQQAAVDAVLNSTADTVVMLLAKAAVCDAHLAFEAEATLATAEALVAAERAVRELQAMEPKP